MKFFLTIILTLVVTGYAIAQENTTNAPKKAVPAPPPVIDGVDPLGRLNYPVVGVLPAVAYKDVNPSITNFMGIAFANGMKGNAYTPFGAVSKDRFDLLTPDLLKNTPIKDLRQAFYYDMVGVPFLMRVDINRFNMIVSLDTVRQKPADPKSPIVKISKFYNCYANLSASIIDVGTTDLLISHNFNITSNSKDAAAQPPQTDSTVAMSRLYMEIREIGQNYHQLLAGVGVIDSILEEKKEKAKVVRVNNTKMLNLRSAGTLFEVYELGETYDKEGVIYQHSEPIGRIIKDNDYHYTKMNFEVIKGESDIYQALKGGKKLVCTMGTLPLSAKPATTAIPSIMIDTFQVKVKGNPGLARMFQGRTTDLLSRRSQLINVVNRNSQKDIETERGIQSKVKSDASQAGITIGADYILTGEIIDYQFKREPVSKAVEQPAPATPPATTAKPATPTNPAPATTTQPARAGSATAPASTRSGSQAPATTTPASTTPAAAPKSEPAIAKPKIAFTQMQVVGTKAIASAQIETKMISVKTGEILWSKILGAAAEKEYPLDKKITDKLIQQEEVNTMLVDNFAAANVNNIFLGITKPLPILKVLDTDKKGIDLILVGGGEHAGINPYMSLVVIEETSEMVDNQSLKRETVVAELRLKEVFPETASWKVKDGGAELQARMAANAKLYCKIRGL